LNNWKPQQLIVAAKGTTFGVLGDGLAHVAATQSDVTATTAPCSKLEQCQSLHF